MGEREDKAEKWAWETFCTAYPHEAAEMDWEKFVAFVREKVPGITEQ